MKAALHEALDNSPLVLRDPAPDVLLHVFDSSAVAYHVLFWVQDYGQAPIARDQVRSNIWYTLRRHAIEIPYPIQIELDQMPAPSAATPPAAALDSVEIFAPLTSDQRVQVLQASRPSLYAAGEVIVREGDSGSSMFVLVSGEASVEGIESDSS